MNEEFQLGILGGGESGVSSALLGKEKKINVFLSEKGNIERSYRNELIEAEISFEEGQHSLDKLLNSDAIIKSPGISSNIPIIQNIKKAGIPIWSDIEWFFRNKPEKSKVIAITGTNGKTSIVTLIGKILSRNKTNFHLGGNIGVGAGRLLLGNPVDIYVLEVSSFQLEDCPTFRPNIAVITNIRNDHLDRYKSIQDYAEAKFKITANQNEDDSFLFYAEDEIIKSRLNVVNASLYPIYTSTPVDTPNQGAFIESSKLIMITKNNDIMTIEDLALQGKHNTYNALAAGLSARLLNVRSEMVRESLANFEGLEHRMENIGTIHGIQFINDSKATNVNSTYYALESIIGKSIWIVGGVDKGNDYSELFGLVEKGVKAIVAIGTDISRIRNAFAESVEHFAEVENMDDAVKTSYQIASKGETVILSPCCASFDLFENYQDRGNQFKSAVRKL
jgi:UDP-N-acetylmuramoylalanine--D-glutamate ligase